MVREPKFEEVVDSEMAADNINKPHEDYPYRVNITREVIDRWIVHQIKRVDELLLHSISHMLWFEWKYREIQVQVWNHIPLPPNIVPSAMYACYVSPVEDIQVIDDLFDWYKTFETIHPYSDWNWRVWGIIVAILSNNIFNKMYAPLSP